MHRRCHAGLARHPPSDPHAPRWRTGVETYPLTPGLQATL
jgi:hypothetical protein